MTISMDSLIAITIAAIKQLATNDGLDYGAPVAQTSPAPAPEALSPPNLASFETVHYDLAERVKLALKHDETRDKVVVFYSTLAGWSREHKRDAKALTTDLFDLIAGLEPPSDHLTHLLTALARTGINGALVQDIERATKILRRPNLLALATNNDLAYSP
jgi:hypothetical protein